MIGPPHVARPNLRPVIISFAAVYVLLFVAGAQSFVLRTIVLPVFALYALTVPDSRRFLRDWVPLLLAVLAYDFMRGVIYVGVQAGYLPVYARYAITLETLLFRTPAAPLAFQPLRATVLDVAAVAIHATHYLFFLIFAVVVWHARRPSFLLYRRALVIVMVVGTLGYAIVPTVPPWLAALPPYELLPPIDHVTARVYATLVPQIQRTFDTNPVAAMPSLHAAFPVVAAIVAWRGFGGSAGAALSLYAALAMIAAMYLGEHYAVDVLAGALIAIAAVWVGSVRPRQHG